MKNNDKRKSYESCSKYISCLIKRNERFSEIKTEKIACDCRSIYDVHDVENYAKMCLLK